MNITTAAPTAQDVTAARAQADTARTILTDQAITHEDATLIAAAQSLARLTRDGEDVTPEAIRALAEHGELDSLTAAINLGALYPPGEYPRLGLGDMLEAARITQTMQANPVVAAAISDALHAYKDAYYAYTDAQTRADSLAAAYERGY